MTHHEFKTDGCTMFPDSNYRGCCVEHDKVYHQGGNYKDRRASDRKLRECVRDGGKPITAWIMWLGVRVGGHPIWPVPWGWGYGIKAKWFQKNSYKKQEWYLNE